jgi:hypothetical protein
MDQQPRTPMSRIPAKVILFIYPDDGKGGRHLWTVAEGTSANTCLHERAAVRRIQRRSLALA